jgi:hypothetical protein
MRGGTKLRPPNDPPASSRCPHANLVSACFGLDVVGHSKRPLATLPLDHEWPSLRLLHRRHRSRGTSHRSERIRPVADNGGGTLRHHLAPSHYYTCAKIWKFARGLTEKLATARLCGTFAALTDLWQGHNRQRGRQNEASAAIYQGQIKAADDIRQGKLAQQAGDLNAGGTILSGAGGFFKNFSQFKDAFGNFG